MTALIDAYIHCKIGTDYREAVSEACRCYAKACSAECDKGFAGILYRQQAHRQRLVCSARDKYGSLPRKFRAEQTDLNQLIETMLKRKESVKGVCIVAIATNKKMR